MMGWLIWRGVALTDLPTQSYAVLCVPLAVKSALVCRLHGPIGQDVQGTRGVGHLKMIIVIGWDIVKVHRDELLRVFTSLPNTIHINLF